MLRSIMLIIALLMGAALAAAATPGGATQAAGEGKHVVIALGDTGINPYHVAFRDTSAIAYQHPSTYLPGYPADAQALHLTFDAPSLPAAFAADAAIWNSLEPNKVYWFPGTKIVAAVSNVSPSGIEKIVAALDPSTEALIFSTGHGTMTAGRAAANEHSLCPECRLAIHEGWGAQAIAWAAAQPWIDVQSHSWSGLVPFNNDLEFPGVREAADAAATRMPVFASAGNGLAGKGGVLGHPAFTRPLGGAKGVIAVGGHDNGFITAWTGNFPHLAADVCDDIVPRGGDLAGYSATGGGTSAATPYSAGEAGRLILEARRILGGAGDPFAGVLASGAPRPELAASPLADGDLTLDELKSLLFRSATARPVATPDDGEICGQVSSVKTDAATLTLPIPWSSYPPEITAYPLIGWGGIDVTSLERALGALHGEPLPERLVDEIAHVATEAARAAWHAADAAAAPVVP